MKGASPTAALWLTGHSSPSSLAFPLWPHGGQLPGQVSRERRRGWPSVPFPVGSTTGVAHPWNRGQAQSKGGRQDRHGAGLISRGVIPAPAELGARGQDPRRSSWGILRKCRVGCADVATVSLVFRLAPAVLAGDSLYWLEQLNLSPSQAFSAMATFRWADFTHCWRIRRADVHPSESCQG